MKVGGQMIYTGPLGRNSQDLLDYFQVSLLRSTDLMHAFTSRSFFRSASLEVVLKVLMCHVAGN